MWLGQAWQGRAGLGSGGVGWRDAVRWLPWGGKLTAAGAGGRPPWRVLKAGVNGRHSDCETQKPGLHSVAA